MVCARYQRPSPSLAGWWTEHPGALGNPLPKAVAEMSDLGLREQLVPDVFEVLPASVYQGPAVLKSRRSNHSIGANVAI
jgi:hypothetical protein